MILFVLVGNCDLLCANHRFAGSWVLQRSEFKGVLDLPASPLYVANPASVIPELKYGMSQQGPHPRRSVYLLVR